IDPLVDRLADRQLARYDLRPKHVKLAEWLGRVLNFTGETLETGEFPTVTNLPTALAVEGRLVEQHLDGFADLGALDALPVLDDREDHALAFVARIAGELGRAMFFSKVEPDVLVGLGARALPRGTSLGLLFRHFLVEAVT